MRTAFFLLARRPGQRPRHRVTHSISPGLAYACRYWTTHLTLGEHTNRLTGLVGGFFQSRLLLWMEVINLTKNIRYATSIIQSAEKSETYPNISQASPRRISVRIGLCQPSVSQALHTSTLPCFLLAQISATLGSIHAKNIRTCAATGTAIDRRRLALIATWKVSTGNIEVYDTTTGESVVSLTEERTKNVYYVAISPDGSKVAFSGLGGTPYVWDTANGSAVTQLLPDGVSGGHSLAFSPDGSRVACGLRNGKVYICALDQTSALMVRSRVISRTSTQSCFSDGLHLASGSNDRTVRVWDVQTGQPVGAPFEGHTAEVCVGSANWTGGARTLTGHSSHVFCVAFSHNGAFIASGSKDNTIECMTRVRSHSAWTRSRTHKLDQIGHLLSRQHSPVSCSDDGTVRVWNVQDIYLHPLPTASSLSSISTPSILSQRHTADARTTHGHEGEVASVDYSADDRYIASGSRQDTANLGWTDGQDIHGPIEGIAKEVWDVSTGQQVTNCSEEMAVSCRRTRRHSGTPRWPIDAHKAQVLSVEFSQDGKRLVSGSPDKSVRIWDAETGKQLVVCGESGGAHSSSVSCRSHPTNGKLIHGPLKGHTDGVECIQFSPDGSHLVSCSYDCTFDSGRIASGNTFTRGFNHRQCCTRYSTSDSHVSHLSLWTTMAGWWTRTVDGYYGSHQISAPIWHSPDLLDHR
ncbi:NUC135 protein [Rhizoctonia solani]|uniref:NUC135 protein n=1 Tax=Rhizoctonia solani TaxID=456999 RepID=A0A8H7I8E3_9AGAM|nr:NUC135 protein [Rhizoctonia solani]